MHQRHGVWLAAADDGGLQCLHWAIPAAAEIALHPLWLDLALRCCWGLVVTPVITIGGWGDLSTSGMQHVSSLVILRAADYALGRISPFSILYRFRLHDPLVSSAGS